MSTPRLQVRTFPLGDWQTNCYVVWAEGGEEAWIIDAGYDPGQMIEAIQKMGLKPSRVILTHAHLDHIGGLAEVRRAWPDIPIHIHEAERNFLTDPELNLSLYIGQRLVAPAATDVLADGQVMTLDGMEVQVRHTPGHSPGGVTLYFPRAGVAIVGDTLFAGSIGRYDFPTSDGPTLMRSIRERLMTLPDETVIHPGHGEASTIGQERETNPFL